MDLELSSSLSLSSTLLHTDGGLGETGVRLPGLPVGSHLGKLLPHHHRHTGPLRHHPVQATLYCSGESPHAKAAVPGTCSR